MSDKPTYEFTINGKSASIADKTPTRAQLLVEAGFEPADDYGLLQRTKHGTKLIPSDETLDLEGGEEFFASDSGSTYELTVNNHSVVWGNEHIDIEILRRVANVPEDFDLIWEHEDIPDEVLPVHGQFSFAGKGIEHLKTKKREHQQFKFYVEGTEYHTNQESLTGAQIMAMVANWDASNSLVLEGDGADPDEVIHPTTVVRFKGRQTPAHFSIVPPATFGVA
jgi:hypothetical protein